ncbi:MAG: tetratricopeptide repeat protein, partial [Methanothrix sp.]|nr:tetratricopeptide repeat protein [Methanothrix sp.]
MNSPGRSALPASFFAYIASAMNDNLSNLRFYYKKHSTTIRAQLSSIRRSISNKIYRKQKEGDVLIELPKEGNWCPEPTTTHRLAVIQKSTINPRTEMAFKQEIGQTATKDRLDICQENNIYDRAAENSYSIEISWCERGLTLSDMGQFEHALDSYNRALKINPRSSKALKDKANVLYRIGRYDEAIDNYKKALEINFQLIDAWYGIGNAMSKLGRYKMAISAYEEALKINTSFIDAWVGKGVALGNIDRYQEAIESFDRAIKINPLLKEALYGKYLALQQIERGEELTKITNKVIAIRKSMEPIPLPLPAASNISENFLVPLRDDFADNFFRTASEFYENERFEEAITYYERAIEINPLIPDAWYERGLALYKLGFYEKALQSFEGALSI